MAGNRGKSVRAENAEHQPGETTDFGHLPSRCFAIRRAAEYPNTADPSTIQQPHPLHRYARKYFDESQNRCQKVALGRIDLGRLIHPDMLLIVRKPIPVPRRSLPPVASDNADTVRIFHRDQRPGCRQQAGLRRDYRSTCQCSDVPDLSIASQRASFRNFRRCKSDQRYYHDD